MTSLDFQSKVESINNRLIIQLPAASSAALPSRGLVMLDIDTSRARLQLPAEPDGRLGHYILAPQDLVDSGEIKSGSTLNIKAEITKNWPEPEIPYDVLKVLENNTAADKTWNTTTTKARWDWLRWIRSTKNPDTRKKRTAVTCSKLAGGERRPCCFNRAMCTDPSVSDNGILSNSND